MGFTALHYLASRPDGYLGLFFVLALNIFTTLPFVLGY
jgi:hypothetical protein